MIVLVFGGPAEVFNLHPLLGDDGGHVGVHGDRHPGLSPLEGFSSPLRVLPLHGVDPLHAEMPESLSQDCRVVFTTVLRIHHRKR